MQKISNYNYLIYWSFILLFSNELIRWVPITSIPIDNFFILLYASLIPLLILYIKLPWKRDTPTKAIIAYQIFLFVNGIAFFRGLLFANNYLAWKKLSTSIDGGISLFVPLAMIVAFILYSHKKLFNYCLSTFKLSFLALLFLFLKEVDFEMYPPLVTPVAFFILLIPYSNKWNKILILTITLIAIYVGLSWRANVLRLLLSICLLVIYYFKSWFNVKLLRLIQAGLLIIPIYFLILGVQGKSIFEDASSYKDLKYSYGDKHGYGEETLIDDTRTFLYKEVLSDLYNTNTLIFGKGISGKYKSAVFVDGDLKSGRSGSEVGFLNILLYTGIVGFLSYTLIIYLAIYYGTSQTKNTLSKILALYLTGHWVLFFVENIAAYNLLNYFDWIIIGLCFSKRFRSLTDEQLKVWVQGKKGVNREISL